MNAATSASTVRILGFRLRMVLAGPAASVSGKGVLFQRSFRTGHHRDE